MKMQNVNGHLSPYCGMSRAKCGVLTLVFGKGSKHSWLEQNSEQSQAPHFKHLECKRIASRKAVAAGTGAAWEVAGLTLVFFHTSFILWSWRGNGPKKQICPTRCRIRGCGALYGECPCKWVMITEAHHCQTLSSVFCNAARWTRARSKILNPARAPAAFKRLIMSHVSKISKGVVSGENSTRIFFF